MRYIARPSLSSRSQKFLQGRTVKVVASSDRIREAKQLWEKRRNKTFEEIRFLLDMMASGRRRCVYCEDSQGTAIDHFWPKSRFPEKAFLWENYLLACSHCNSNEKRDEFPLSASGEAMLVDPTKEDPGVHLALSLSTGIFVGLTEKGRETIRVFGLNREVLSRGRVDAWIVLKELLVRYGKCRWDADAPGSSRILEVIKGYPFSCVLMYISAAGVGSRAEVLIGQDVLNCLLHFPELMQWLPAKVAND